MGAIEQPSLTDPQATALQNTSDEDTGVLFLPHGHQRDATPPLRTLYTQWAWQNRNLLRMIAGGAVIDRNDGLKVAVLGLNYRIGATEYTLPGDNEFTCSDDETCYLYCDADEVVEELTTGWPATDHIKLAIVTTASGEVTAVTPALFQNHTSGIDSAWSEIAATQQVGMGGFGLGDLGALKMEHANATIASGILAVGANAGALSVKGEGSATDNLETITSDANDEMRVLRIRRHSAGEGNIYVRHGDGNIHLCGGIDCWLTEDHHWLELGKYVYTGGQDEWTEISRNASDHYTSWNQQVDAQSYNLRDLGQLAFNGEGATIATGTIVLTSQAVAYVFPETGGATDQLDEISLGSAAWGDANPNGILIIKLLLGTNTVLVKHDNAGSNKAIHLQNGIDFFLTTVKHTLVLRYDHGNDYFVEVSRSPQTLASLEATEACISSPIEFYWPGTITVKAFEQEKLIAVDGWIRTATGRVSTAPSGGPCYIDVQIDEGGGYGSIFGADPSKIHIIDGGNEDTATTPSPWQEVSAGDRLRIACVTSANAAADLSVMVDFRTKVQAPE